MNSSLPDRRGGTLILDGVRLAHARAADQAARARRITALRGTPPRLALLAFADEAGAAPHAARKLRAGSAAGLELNALVLPAGVTTRGAVRALMELLGAGSYDGVFIEFPFPAGISAAELTALIPESRDIDIMTEGRTRRYLAGLDPHPPLTISAALELLAAYEVEIAGLPGVVVAEPTAFAHIFREALARRGAEMREVISPDAPDLEACIRGAKVVVATAARPGLLRTGWLERGAVVIDAGYFNPHGRGDIDTSDGIGHLAAIAPVPGGVGPMTVSTMIERLLDWAERSETGP